MYTHGTSGRPVMEPCVLFPHTRYTEVYMDRLYRYTPRCACVYTHSEVTLCCTIDHRGSLAIALVVQFLKTFKLCFIYSFFFFKIIGAATAAPAAPLPTPLRTT